MYCPKCAGSNADDSKFCRLCGTDLSLVSQAMTGRIQVQPTEPDWGRGLRRRDRKHGPPTLYGGLVQLFMGCGFLIVTLALMLSHQYWGIFLLFAAFPNLARGAASIISVKQAQSAFPQSPPYSQTPVSPPVIRSAPRTGELYENPAPPVIPPASVTEGTTRIMNRNPELREKA
ncbi:MAG: hypothetical protein ACREDR_03455 [Blastocatellia bacterium]